MASTARIHPVETEIKLADHLIPPMLAGVKKVTIRKGIRFFAEVITIAGHKARVKEVQWCSLANVPLEVLIADGFTSFQDTLDSMKQFYPDITTDTSVTIIKFELVKDVE